MNGVLHYMFESQLCNFESKVEVKWTIECNLRFRYAEEGLQGLTELVIASSLRFRDMYASS